MTQKTIQVKVRGGLRIIWAVAWKDIVDAAVNKTFLSIAFAALTIVLTGKALPFLTQLRGIPVLYVYDAGQSALTDALSADETIRLHLAESREDLERALVQSGFDVLGLVIPADFDQRLEAESEVELAGLTAWSTRFAAPKMTSEWEERLANLLGRPVSIDATGHVVYPSLEDAGSVSMPTSILLTVIVTFGTFVVPHMLFEEKRCHTIDVLHISPATLYQIMCGKAIAGLSYTLVAAGAVLAFNAASVVHWDVAILASVAGGLFAVGMGLILGSLFDDAQDLGLWIGIPFIIMLLPTTLSIFPRTIPEPFATLLRWIPTVPLSNALTASFFSEGNLGHALPQLAITLATCLPLYAIAVWIARRRNMSA